MFSGSLGNEQYLLGFPHRSWPGAPQEDRLFTTEALLHVISPGCLALLPTSSNVPQVAFIPFFVPFHYTE